MSTPGPWAWWTSNSWRRLYATGPQHQNVSVLSPVVCRDGHPDLVVSESDMALIVAAPELLELANKYASECGECAGVGITIDDEDCSDCKFIRDVIAKAAA